MPDNRTQAEKDQETIDYYVNNSSLTLIEHKIIEAKKRLFDAERAKNGARIIHYSWLIQVLETARTIKHQSTEDAQKGRGPYFFKKDRGVAMIWLGDPSNPESEHTITIHDDWISDLIATLQLIKQKG